MGGAHGPVQPCRFRTSALQQPRVSSPELVGAHTGNQGLLRRLAGCDHHSCPDCADLAKRESWVIGSCVRPAWLFAVDRMAGAPTRADCSGFAHPVALRHGSVRSHTGHLPSRRELDRSRRWIRWRDTRGSSSAEGS